MDKLSLCNLSMLLLALLHETDDKRRCGPKRLPAHPCRKEIVMRDQYDARLWNDSHEQTRAGIDRLLARIMQAFRVLHRIHWAAPWADQRNCPGR